MKTGPVDLPIEYGPADKINDDTPISLPVLGNTRTSLPIIS
jgi:hypothetical protein